MQIEITLAWIYGIGGLLTGSIVTGVLVAAGMTVSRNRLDEEFRQYRFRVQEQEEEWEKQRQNFREEKERWSETLEACRIENARLRSRIDGLGQMLMAAEERGEARERELRAQREAILSLEKELSEAQTRLEEERERARARLEELRDARTTLQKEFKILAEKILEENSRRFGDLSSDRVEEVLKPLRTQMAEFRDRIDRVHTEETRQRATLMQEVRQLRELNRRIGEEAESLSKALKGESKTRGIWGEMVLERVLEASGLREGEEYVRERTMRNAEHRRLRPDVIVYLPDRRELVVDAKTSLVAYERYANAEDEGQKRRYAKEHLAAVKRHIDELAQKDYSRVEGIETLDFVMMFLPIEGALALALQEDPGLYDEAFSRHVVLVSPTALLVALRAVENSWRRERQNRNARKIARQAGALYDKFVAFAEDMERIGRQLETVQKSYDASWNKLSSGRNNIVRQIEKLRELGAETSREIPSSMADEALGDEENEQ